VTLPHMPAPLPPIPFCPAPTPRASCQPSRIAHTRPSSARSSEPKSCTHTRHVHTQTHTNTQAAHCPRLQLLVCQCGRGTGSWPPAQCFQWPDGRESPTQLYAGAVEGGQGARAQAVGTLAQAEVEEAFSLRFPPE